jgi:hypothetical protein
VEEDGRAGNLGPPDAPHAMPHRGFVGSELFQIGSQHLEPLQSDIARRLRDGGEPHARVCYIISTDISQLAKRHGCSCVHPRALTPLHISPSSAPIIRTCTLPVRAFAQFERELIRELPTKLTTAELRANQRAYSPVVEAICTAMMNSAPCVRKNVCRFA